MKGLGDDGRDTLERLRFNKRRIGRSDCLVYVASLFWE